MIILERYVRTIGTALNTNDNANNIINLQDTVSIYIVRDRCRLV